MSSTPTPTTTIPIKTDDGENEPCTKLPIDERGIFIRFAYWFFKKYLDRRFGIDTITEPHIKKELCKIINSIIIKIGNAMQSSIAGIPIVGSVVSFFRLISNAAGTYTKEEDIENMLTEYKKTINDHVGTLGDTTKQAIGTTGLNPTTIQNIITEHVTTASEAAKQAISKAQQNAEGAMNNVSAIVSNVAPAKQEKGGGGTKKTNKTWYGLGGAVEEFRKTTSDPDYIIRKYKKQTRRRKRRRT